MCSTEIIFIFPKTRVHSGSNGMHTFFLPLTQATQFEFKKSTHYLIELAKITPHNDEIKIVEYV